MENMKIYEAVRKVPDSAKKNIRGGRLKGMTDINPMWRIKALTEQFGPCGIGWKVEVSRTWQDLGADGVVTVYVQLLLYVKYNDAWSALRVLAVPRWWPRRVAACTPPMSAIRWLIRTLCLCAARC